MLTQQKLKEILRYEPETGTFFWRFSAPGRSIKREAGSVKTSDGYRQIMIEGRNYYAHRLAFLYMTGDWPKYGAEHKDRNRKNNRWENLRDIPHDLNLLNKNVRGYKEYMSAKGLRYEAYIKERGLHIHLGIFSSKEEALEARRKAIQRRFEDHCEKIR